jgi:hypothetical protein
MIEKVVQVKVNGEEMWYDADLAVKMQRFLEERDKKYRHPAPEIFDNPRRAVKKKIKRAYKWRLK